MPKFILDTSVGFRYRLLLLGMMALLLDGSGMANGQDTWMTYEGGAFRALEANARLEVFHIELNLKGKMGQSINLSAEKTFSVWVNHQLIASGAENYSIEVNQLLAHYGPSLLLSLRHAGGWQLKELPQVHFQLPRDNAFPLTSQSANVMVADYKIDNFLSLALLIWLGLIALFRVSYPKMFLEYFNPGSIIFRRLNQDALIQARQFNPGTIMALCLVSYQLVMAFMLFLPKLQTYPPLLGRLRSESASVMLISLLVGTVVVVAVLFIKYGLLRFLSDIFGFSFFAKLHFFDYLRISSFIYLFVNLIGIIGHWQSGVGAEDWVPFLIWVVLSLYFLRIFYLLVKLSSTTELRISYLFSYLCTTEIIPLALGIYWILKG